MAVPDSTAAPSKPGPLNGPLLRRSGLKPRAYRNYLLLILLLVGAFNYVDRTALALVLQSIKLDLHLSDAELGFLTGMAFAFFYSIMGIPIGRWADRGNRITIISLTTATWSVMVALTGRATSFAQLLLIRSGVAVGEAGCMPTANSLLPDYFSRAERPRAMAIYLMGGSLSLLIGYFVAGWLNQLFGWRLMFLLLSLPGVLLAALVRFTLREPRLEQAAPAPDHSSAGDPVPAQPSVVQVLRTLCTNACFRHVLLAFAVGSFFAYGIGTWLPTFFIRSYGFKTGDLGTWFTLVYGLPGIAGVYLGGEWASRWAANRERLQLLVMAIGLVGCGLLQAAVYLTHHVDFAFALIAVATLANSATAAPLTGMLQTMVPPRVRGLSIAIVYLFANLIGMGLGPLATGALSDALHPHFGVDSLRYALLMLTPCAAWGAWHIWRASRTVNRAVEAADAEKAG